MIPPTAGIMSVPLTPAARGGKVASAKIKSIGTTVLLVLVGVRLVLHGVLFVHNRANAAPAMAPDVPLGALRPV